MRPHDILCKAPWTYDPSRQTLLGGVTDVSSTIALARPRVMFSPTLTMVSRMAEKTVPTGDTPGFVCDNNGASPSSFKGIAAKEGSSCVSLLLASEINAAVCAISMASLPNSSFLPTKSVSQFNSIIAALTPPAVVKPAPCERTDTPISPSFVCLHATFAAFEAPVVTRSFLSHSRAPAMSPFE